MKKTLLWFALALIVGAAVLQQIENDSGYVLIVWGKTSVEMSLWLAVTLLVSLIGGSWLIWRLTAGSVRTARVTLGQLLFGHSRRSQKSTARGLIDFMEGNWKQSRRQLLKGVSKAETPLINYLAAARSAYEMGDHKEAFDLLHQAEKSAPNSELAVSLTQARMQLLDKKYEQCVATLERAKRAAPKHPVVLDLLRQVYVEVQDWNSLQEVMPDLRRHKIGSQQDLDELELTLSRALIVETGELAQQKLGRERIELIGGQWQKLPGSLQKNPDMVLAYAEQLLANHGHQEAEAIIRKTLQKQWSEPLLHLYGKVEGQDRARQLLTAESWLKERPGNALLMLTLGRLCLRNELWGRAREYFENSLRLQKNPEAYAELARLLANLGEHKKSTEYYQQGLLMTTHGLPNLPMPHLTTRKSA